MALESESAVKKDFNRKQGTGSLGECRVLERNPNGDVSDKGRSSMGSGEGFQRC